MKSLTLTILFIVFFFINTEAQQMKDPLYGNHTLGNSAELVTLRPQIGGENCYLKLYDYTGAKNITGMTVEEQSGTWALGGHKQMDVVCGDFNSDGYDDIVAAWEGADKSIILMIPRINQGNLSWSDAHKINLGANTIYGPPDYLSPSTCRLVRAQFDTDTDDEFLLAYWGADQNICLTAYNTSDELLPESAGSIADAKLDASLDANAVFDVACGDFDRNGIDEVLLARTVPSNKGRSVNLRLYSYDIDNQKFILQMSDTVLFDTNVHLRQIALAAGDLNNDGFDEAAITFLEFRYRWQSIWEGLTRYNYFYVTDKCMIYTMKIQPNLKGIILAQESPHVEYEKEEFHLKVKYGSSTTVYYVPKPMTLTCADLNNDGRDEILSLNMGWLRIYQPDNSLKLDEGIHQSVSHKRYDVSRRTVIVADLDATKDNATSSGWYPEIIVSEWSNDDTRQLRVFGPTIKENGTFEEIHQIPNTNYIYLDEFKFEKYMSLTFAAGNFDGDGVKLGEPGHHTKTLFQPTTIICAPPLHYDILEDTVYDITGCYTSGGSFWADYTRSVSDIWQIQTELRSDWGVSLSASGSYSPFGCTIQAYMSLNFGAGFSKTRFSTSTITGQTNISTVFDDKIYASVNKYDIWEYPIYSDGTIIPEEYVLVVVPSVVQDGNSWFDSKSKGDLGKLYTPNHELGNIFSYYKDGDLTTYPGIDKIVYSTDNFTLASGSLTWNVNFEHFTGGTDLSYYQVAMNVGASVSAYGIQVGVSGNYSQQGLVTTTVSVYNGLNFDVNLGSVPSDASYDVRPFLYWAENGALVLDYAVTPLTFTGEKSWWQQNYEDKSDLSFILPWRYDYEKGFSVSDADRHRTRDIVFEPAKPDPGDTVIVKASLHNFSLKNTDQTVEMKFYIGDPGEGGILIESIAGDTLFSTSSFLLAREAADIEFIWKIPENIPYYPKIYAVIDPDNKIDEIHEENNLGYRILEVEGSVFIENNKEKILPADFALEQNYPNPFNPSTTIHYTLKQREYVKLAIYDLLGREVKVLVDREQPAGPYDQKFNASDLSSGVYIYMIKAGKFEKARKMVVMK